MRGPFSLRAGQPARVWGALALPPFAWFGYEIGLSAVVRTACPEGGPPVGSLVGAAALAVCGLAAWLASGLVRRPGNEDEQPRRFLAGIAVGLAAVFSLAIAFQTAATLLVPPCAR